MISDMCRARALSRCSSNEWAVKFVSDTRRSDDKRAITYNSLILFSFLSSKRNDAIVQMAKVSPSQSSHIKTNTRAV